MADFVCTIFFGWLGTYRFSKGQTLLGFVYMLTFGLFGIGWLVDICLSYKEIDFDSLKSRNNELYFNTKDDYTSTISKNGWIIEQRINPNLNDCEKIKKRYFVVDLKTSGYNPSSDRIVEIAVALFENGRIVKKISTLVNAKCKISKDAAMIHKITNKMIKKSPNESSVFMQLVEFIDDAILGNTYICVHNSKRDIEFLSNTLERLGYKGKLVYIDTADFSKKIINDLQDYRLYTVADNLKIEFEPMYRSEYDSEVAGEILWSLLNLER